jgi:uncharacterized membrane protein YphA (DoxX/SURF4 family)
MGALTTMTTSTMQAPDEDNLQRTAGIGLAIVRVIVGGELFSTFFENLGKGAYSPAGYAGVLNYYVQHSHSPEAWRHLLAMMASRSAILGPMQAVMEISVGTLLIVGLFTRPAALVAFLFLGTLWVTELGTSWIWELLVPFVASLGLLVGRAGRTWGVDAILARKWPSSLLW